MTPYTIIFIAALLTSSALTPAARWLSFRWRALAQPGGRRRHQGLVPKLGGLPLFAAFLVGAALTYWYLPPSGDDALRLRGVLLGSAILFVGGLIDDRWELTAAPQFLVQFAGTAVAIGHIIFIEVFTNPLTGEQVWLSGQQIWLASLPALLLTVLWTVGMINAVNWLDGLDGLAVGVGAIAALLFAWHSYRLGQTTVALFPLALAGALLGFLPFNYSPARIFLGTAGAYFLGYTLATLSILAPAKIATALLVLAVPIIDGAWLVIGRLRQHRSPFQGDRNHLHFRLADMGLPAPVIVLGYYGVALVFGLVAIFASGLVKLALLLVLTTAVLALLVSLSRGE
jgi:UDP-GlcNAc:undecaprenyl-phosphate/decaprenyl-phosphate GlcNAc-1-phosphate transferase